MQTKHNTRITIYEADAKFVKWLSQALSKEKKLNRFSVMKMELEPFPERTVCTACSGRLVKIRGRYVPDPERSVCPVCLADRMDQIRDISDKDYGKAYRLMDIPKPIKP